MDLSLIDEEEALVATFDALFDKWASATTVRESEELGFDERVWNQAVSAGATAMSVASDGVDAASFFQLALVAECSGRHLAPIPLVESMVAARLIERSGHAEAATILHAIAEGTLIPTISLREPSGGVGGPGAPGAEREVRLVPAGAVAGLVLALDGDELVAVASAPPVVARRNVGAMAIAHRSVSSGRRLVLGVGADARRAYEHALVEWKALTAAALVGLSSSALSIGVQYAKSRVAFGAPIATFQTVSHRLADRATAVDGARLLAYEAAWALDELPDRAGVLSSMAFCFAAETALDVTRDSLHFHGGYGFTIEYDIQLYFRRAKAWALVWGDPARERRRLAQQLFIEDREGDHGLLAR